MFQWRICFCLEAMRGHNVRCLLGFFIRFFKCPLCNLRVGYKVGNDWSFLQRPTWSHALIYEFLRTSLPHPTPRARLHKPRNVMTFLPRPNPETTDSHYHFIKSREIFWGSTNITFHRQRRRRRRAISPISCRNNKQSTQ